MVRQVPAPTIASGASAAAARIASMPAGVRRVISTSFTPPAARARASGGPCCASCTVTTATSREAATTGAISQAGSAVIGVSSRVAQAGGDAGDGELERQVQPVVGFAAA